MNFPIVFQTLKKKGLDGCESPDAERYFEEETFSKLNEDSDFVFKRDPVSIVLPFFPSLYMLILFIDFTV